MECQNHMLELAAAAAAERQSRKTEVVAEESSMDSSFCDGTE